MKNKLDELIIKYMLINVLLMNWLTSFSGILKNISLILLVFLILIDSLSKYRSKNLLFSAEILATLILFAFISANVVLFGLNYRAIVNLFFFFCSLISITYVAKIYIYKPYVLNFFMTKKWVFGLNAYFWINMIIIHIQNRVPGFLMLGYESIYDNMTGLFGIGSTHIITMFCSLLTCMNIEYMFVKKNTNVFLLHYI